MKKLILPFLILVAINSAQADIMEDFDSLGGNNILLDKAKSLEPDKDIQIVQNRVVRRENRHELSPEASMVLGGDSYLSTNFTGLSYNYHLNPRWSLGARYGYASNRLRSEGKNLIDQMGFIPDLDWPEHLVMGHLTYYPFYGKFSFFNSGIVHFDFYATLGAGNMITKTDSSMTYTGGVGIGLWISQHLTSRIEFRYQNYESQRKTGSSSLDLTVATFSLGYMI